MRLLTPDKLLHRADGRRTPESEGLGVVGDETTSKRSRPRQTFKELRELHRLTMQAITRPLSADSQTQRVWLDGRPTAAVVESFIAPNDRLTSLERLEIYNKQYWYRLLDCLYDDYPGLRAILGERKFRQLRIAYLSKYPSHSFTLRDLGGRLERFLIEEPQWVHPHEQMALHMARFEWAQIVAFDGEARPPLAVDSLLSRDPDSVRLALQPYLTLLELAYPLDDFVLAVKKRDAALRGEASNAIEADAPARPADKASPPRRPRSQKVFLAVHRFDNSIYYKRLTTEGFAILTALRDGKSLTQACAIATRRSSGEDSEWASQLGQWFKTWAELGWFCSR